MSGQKHWEQDKEATVYVGNIDERATDALIYELMLQMGPVVNVHLPKDRVTQAHQAFGFVEFNTEADADYAARCINGVRLFGKPLRVNKASSDKQRLSDVGAELFVGNLDPSVDEKVLYDTFSRFGTLMSAPKVARDDQGVSKGYGFVSYSAFEPSDDAIASMNGQYLMNKEVSVQYAYKKDGKGERHGDDAERKLAAQAKMHNIMPELQAMPPGLLGVQPAPSGANASSLSSAPPASAPSAPSGHHHHPHHHHAPAGGAHGGMAPPQGFAPPPPPQFGGLGGYDAAVAAQPPPMGGLTGVPMHLVGGPVGGYPPPAPPGGFGGVPAGPRGGVVMPPPPAGPRGGGVALPPPPLSGLPARPPPSQAGYNGPTDLHGGVAAGAPPSAFRGLPPPGPGGAPPPGAAGLPPPPPGFGGVPPPGGGGVPPPGVGAGLPPPPPGFLPPPGFGRR